MAGRETQRHVEANEQQQQQKPNKNSAHHNIKEITLNI